MKLATIMVIKTKINLLRSNGPFSWQSLMWSNWQFEDDYTHFITFVGRILSPVLDSVPVYRVIITPKPQRLWGKTRHWHIVKSSWENIAGSIVVMTDLDLYWSTHYSLIWGRLWIFAKMLYSVQPSDRLKCLSSHCAQYILSPSSFIQYIYTGNKI